MTVSVQLQPEIEKRLLSLADRVDRPVVPFLQEIIERGIDDLEDGFYASEILQRVDKGQEKTHSAYEVRIALGLGD
uniref:RHH-type transcriptional regulator, rel operon repressor / antitoxin RelB n=1 Tax=Candidatus Kentrum sp. SD TaxID=2126332 RepID=A0A450YBK8_9GAMM|nr:MAG: RHH-type transcriptional regulator, rel operon repressor / antitoxin RelB [Candidatus Kentron sp. SD]VFK43163.1 MAG: RHH-type transcriptional regulator, rel operon repressor / antitoxin RelB [Candidatus Kentron sp. SD]VFK80154.1 MAG: RHH-type transcriptional regulator, rel operon repressor / antitoxin RelB [Candidatus Kentron sp. SD]